MSVTPGDCPGRALPGIELRSVDPVTLDDVPVGAHEEVLVRGG